MTAPDPATEAPDADAPLMGPSSHPWPWLVSRITGLFLAVMVPVQFWAVVIRDDVGATTLATVIDRFEDPRWQAFEWLTLVLALLHAVLALRAIVARTPWSPAMRNRMVAAVGVVAGLLALTLTWSMFSLA